MTVVSAEQLDAFVAHAGRREEAWVEAPRQYVGGGGLRPLRCLRRLRGGSSGDIGGHCRQPGKPHAHTFIETDIHE